MPSESLHGLFAGLDEVRNLQSANPILLGGFPNKPLVVKAVNRASVVLLCGYLERYLRSVNEEAADVVNVSNLAGTSLPMIMRLQHSQLLIDNIAKMQWKNRGDNLKKFLVSDGWLWISDQSGKLEHARMLRWMRSPTPDRIKRLFELWGIGDIFSAITRTPHTRSHFWLKIAELAEKRNRIAHGDLEASSTGGDIRIYLVVVREFSQRTDAVLSKRLGKLCGHECPW